MGQGVVLYYKMNEFPGVAQLVARQLWELDVVRSSRTTRTNAVWEYHPKRRFLQRRGKSVNEV